MKRPATTHLGLALALSGLGLTQAVGAGHGAGWAAAVLLGTAAVGLTGISPVALAAAAAVSTAGQVALVDTDPAFASFLVLLVAGYALGRHSGTRGLLAGLVLLVLAVAAVIVADPTLQTPAEPVYPAVYLSGAVGLGRLVRSRERAARTALLAVADAAEGREREALAEERRRITREMHDVVAHSLSLLVVQAESAAAVLDRDPARARAQLDRIGTTGRQALEELRRVLGLLQPGGGDPAAAHPQPGLADLHSLGSAVEATGTRVLMQVDGALTDVPPGVQLTAYRVVQEALTNAVRHGRARQVDVQVRRHDGRLLVDVQDDGCTSAPSSTPGHGLRGMRERVRLYDGQLETGPADGGGFRVAASIPVAP